MILPIMPPATVPPITRPSADGHSSASDDSLMMQSPRLWQHRFDELDRFLCYPGLIGSRSRRFEPMIDLGLGMAANTFGERGQPIGDALRGSAKDRLPRT